MMLMTMAAVPALTALVGILNPRIRNVETELPDAVRKEAPAPAAEPAEPETAPAAAEAAAEA
jgi:hypothetical protein